MNDVPGRAEGRSISQIQITDLIEIHSAQSATERVFILPTTPATPTD
jgi:hypothetical protein